VLNAYEGVIGIMQNLRPTLLDDLGLSAALKSLLDKHLGEKGTSYFMHTRGEVDKRIRPAAEITIFRIFQEAILNAARHARAENVFVLIEGEDHEVRVEMEDDGEGFALHSIFHQTTRDGKDRRGLGLLGMKERALLLGGKLEICSQPGIGTKIELKVPLAPVEALHAEEEGTYRG
jgi:signal transduction histidine kinase